MKRRTFLIGSVSGVSLLALSACTPETPAPTPSPTVPALPSHVPQPVAFQRTNWTEDPFSYGAFSYDTVGSGPRDRSALREPVEGRLFFAGEATSEEDPGTVYGARQSGLHAAIAVAAVAEQGERIAIIGAGVAGATAARRLSDRGFDVVVLEGRDRAGGRIHSFEGEEWPFPVELGAAFVQTSDATIAAELQNIGVEVVSAPFENELRTQGATQIVASEVGRDAVEAAIEWAAMQSSDTSLADALQSSGAADLDATPVAGGVSDAQRLAHYLQTNVVIEQAAEPNDLSSWFAKDPETQEQQQQDRRLVVGGYQEFVSSALENLSVLPSSTVSEVTTTERGVSLRLSRGDSLSADRVVVTVPLGVLKAGTIEFSPPLPFSHRGAIDALGVGTQDKLVLRFEEPFWSTTATRWGVLDEGTDFPLWVNLLPFTGEPILVAMIGGEAAERLSKLSDEEVLESALESLKPFID